METVRTASRLGRRAERPRRTNKRLGRPAETVGKTISRLGRWAKTTGRTTGRLCRREDNCQEDNQITGQLGRKDKRDQDARMSMALCRRVARKLNRWGQKEAGIPGCSTTGSRKASRQAGSQLETGAGV